MRLIHFLAEADIDSAESWIKIRPLIINLVSNEWLAQIRSHLADSMLLLDDSEAHSEPDVNEEDDRGPGKQSPHLSRSLFAVDN